MNRIVEPNYGADADGNRGIEQVFFEIDDDDTPEIQSQIIEYIESTEEIPEFPFTVYLIDPVSESDVELEIDPLEYFTKEGLQEIIDNLIEE